MRLLAIVALALVCCLAEAAAQSGRPRDYCQCRDSCEARGARCLKAFDEDCGKTPQPANCDAAFRARCDQAAGLCNLNCGTAFRAKSC